MCAFAYGCVRGFVFELVLEKGRERGQTMRSSITGFAFVAMMLASSVSGRDIPIGRYIDCAAETLLELSTLSLPQKANLVKAEGLPKGLKLLFDKATQVWYIYGVPTELLDEETQAAYLRVTDPLDKSTSLVPLSLSVVSVPPAELPQGVCATAYLATNVSGFFPDYEANDKTWTFSGFPSGLTVKNGQIAGTPKKAGDFTVTGTKTLKNARGTFKETYPATLRVWADDNKSESNTVRVQEPTLITGIIDTVVSFSGLPSGLKFTKVALQDKKQGYVPPYSIYGIPTKAGTFVVTATWSDKRTSKSLMIALPPEVPQVKSVEVSPEKGLKSIVQGAAVTTEFAVPAGAKVSASGLPAGLKLVQGETNPEWGPKDGGNSVAYQIQGVPTKTGDSRVTIKVTLNGVTTTWVVAYDVVANPFTGTYRGACFSRPDLTEEERVAVYEITFAEAGTVKLVYTEGKNKYTATAKSFELCEGECEAFVDGLVLKASSADRKLGFSDRRVRVGMYRSWGSPVASLEVSDANGNTLSESCYSCNQVEKTETVDGLPPDPCGFVFTSSSAEPLLQGTAVFSATTRKVTVSGKLFDGTAFNVTTPLCVTGNRMLNPNYYSAPFLVTAKNGASYALTVCAGIQAKLFYLDGFESRDKTVSVSSVLTDGQKLAACAPENGALTLRYRYGAIHKGACYDIEPDPVDEVFATEIKRDAKGNPTALLVYDMDAAPGEKPLATLSSSLGKTTGQVSFTLTSKKNDRAKSVIDLVWLKDNEFRGQVIRTWKDADGDTQTAFGIATLKAQ